MLKSKLVVAVSMAVVSCAALADGPELVLPYESSTPSTLTRAQVLAEAQQARARGEVMLGDGQFAVATAPSTRSRREVMAELREAQRLGLTGSAEVVFGTPEQEALIAKAGAAAAAERHIAVSGSVRH